MVVTLTERQFDTGTVIINYAEGPKTGAPLVVLHGATGRWQGMQSILPALAERWHVYALDLRGHGKSGRVTRQYRLADYVEDAIAFIRGCVGEPAIVYGHSLGGLVAMNTAAQSRKDVRAIILEDPALVEYTHRPEEIFAHPYFRGAYETLQVAPSIEEILRWLKTISPPDTPTEAIMPRAETLSLLDSDMLVPILEGKLVQKGTLADVVKRMACPVLLLQADPAIGAATEDQHVAVIREHMPQATVVQIKGASHGIHDSQLDALLKQAIPFLDALETQ
jgi:pimeloyl-ACP methyl ester carboxylesterase